MQTTEILAEEHRWIRRMLDCLEKLVERCRESERLDHDTTSELLRLFESFADGQHQEKEEKHLFPLLLREASVDEANHIRELLDEHVSERGCMLSMRSNLLGAIHGEPLCLREFARVAESYVELHRKHMANETVVMLPMAERTLTSSDDLEVLEGFGTVESAGPEAMTRVLERIECLCGRLGVPLEESAA